MRGSTSFIFRLAIILLTCLCVDGFLYAEVLIKDPGTYVVDTAGVMQASDKQQLEGWLRELEQKTTAQVKVLTVQTTEGEDIFGFAQRHAEAWKLGQAGKDNGALIALALQEHRVRIQIGYGLEGSLWEQSRYSTVIRVLARVLSCVT